METAFVASPCPHASASELWSLPLQWAPTRRQAQIPHLQCRKPGPAWICQHLRMCCHAAPGPRWQNQAGFSLVFTYMPQGASWISWNRPLIVLPPRHQNRPASGVSSSLRPLLSAAPGAVGLARSRSCQAAEIEELTTNNRGMNGNSNWLRLHWLRDGKKL